MKPITRMDYFKKAVAEGTLAPIRPVTREEILMAKHASREASGPFQSQMQKIEHFSGSVVADDVSTVIPNLSISGLPEDPPSYSRDVVVTINGVEYETICHIDINSYMVFIGCGEDFTIVENAMESSTPSLSPTVPGETYNIKIETIEEVVVPIDPKYLGFPRIITLKMESRDSLSDGYNFDDIYNAVQEGSIVLLLDYDNVPCFLSHVDDTNGQLLFTCVWNDASKISARTYCYKNDNSISSYDCVANKG